MNIRGPWPPARRCIREENGSRATAVHIVGIRFDRQEAGQVVVDVAPLVVFRRAGRLPSCVGALAALQYPVRRQEKPAQGKCLA